MPARFLGEADADRLLTMSDAVDCMQEAFAALADGTARNTPRRRTRGDGIILHSMSAAADYLGRVGWKEYTTTRAGAHFHVGLYSQATGKLEALIAADRLGQMRTGAVTGLACRYLAPQNATVGLIGAGWQAESQLEAVAATLPQASVRVFARRAPERTEFAARMADRHGVPVEPVDHPRDAVEGLPVVITATTSRTPVLETEWIAPDSLVCAMGSNWLEKAELDVAAVGEASAVVCDSVAACRVEAGELAAAAEAGAWNWDAALELADIVGGKVAPPTSGRRVFKSVGLAIEDVAIASRLLDRAREAGVGIDLPE